MEREIIDFGPSMLKLNLRKLSMDRDSTYRGAHIHNEIELVRADEGTLVCHLESGPLSLEAGQILFINRRVIHRLHADNPAAKFSYIQIDMDSYIRHLNPYFEQFPLIFMYSNTTPYAVYDDTCELWQLFGKIETELIEKTECYEEYIKANIYFIAAFMFRNGFLTKDAYRVSAKNMEKIMPSVKYLEDNYQMDMTLEDISGISSLDKFYFCKLFKQTLGITCTEYLNYIRLYHAEELLIKTDMNISEIALCCGFNSIQYFNRIFRREKNCTPRQFKELIN